MEPERSVSPNEAVVTAMWLAHAEGRIDDMVALMRTNVTWRPWSRPGLSVYVGHDGIRHMVADIRFATGPYSIQVESISEVEPDRVVALGTIETAHTSSPVRFDIVLRNGLVHEVRTTVPGADQPPG